MVYLSQLAVRPARRAKRAAEAAAGRRSHAERRVNVSPRSAAPQGEVELHALDASHLRRAISGAWRFEGLLDPAVAAAALQIAVDRFPLVAGWLERHGTGGLALRWDADADGRGAAWYEAIAPGSPPEVTDDVLLYETQCLPTMKRHCLLAAKVTQFPDANATLMVITIDHVVADYKSFLDFLSAWSDECEAIAAASRGVGAAPCAKWGARPAPVWDRSLLVDLSPPVSRASSSSGSGSSGSRDGTRTPPQAASEGGSSGVADNGVSSSGSGSTDGSSAVARAGKDSAFWEGEPVWHVDVLSRRQNVLMLGKGLLGMAGCESRSWVLPRAAIDGLKARLSGAAGGGAAVQPTTNDVLSALVAASVAWVSPGKVARRGGLNAHVVVNSRGRFGHAAGDDFFGNTSLLVPVWCPAALLPAADAPSPEPSAALAAHIHSALREELSAPAGLMRRRYEWMAAAQGAGVGGAVRSCEAAALLEGDVCIDNVSKYDEVFSVKFGGAAPASSNSMRFLACPRLAWVTAAGPTGHPADGSSHGDLRVSLALKRKKWARLAPWWKAMGLRQVGALGTLDVMIYHPTSLRNLVSEVTRTPVMGL